jgi:hypothetical protein
MLDKVGIRYGRLVVIESAGRDKYRSALWKCLCDCGGTVVTRGTTLSGGRVKSCGCLHDETAQKLRVKDGRTNNGAGYVRVSKPKHLNANKRGYVYEHVLVMSENIGRPLEKGETVHHINGVRDDNRIENLELWSTSHPPGQRVEDKRAWAKEILARYPDTIWMPH